MDFLTRLENNSILVIPNNLKDKILDYMDKHNLRITIKFMSFKDLRVRIMYDYGNEAIFKIMKHFNVNYGVAVNYIDDTYYLYEANHDKIKHLNKVKDLLDNDNLLIYDKLFFPLLKSKSKLYVYGFDYINKFNNYLLDKVKPYIEVEVIEKENHDYKHTVYELDTMSEEITFVAENISKLLANGVKQNKIWITNYSNEYYFTMKRIFGAYSIPYYTKGETCLYDTAMGTYFLKHLEGSKEMILHNLRKEFKIKPNENHPVYERIVALINTYYWCENLSDIADLIKEEMKKTSIRAVHYTEEIRTTNLLDNCFDDDEYVFLIGFNLSSVPKLKRDEDYLSDDIKPPFLETSYEYNNIKKELYKKAIRNIKNLTITCKLSSAFNTYYPSFLIDGDYLKKEHVKIDISNYSNSLNKYMLGIKIDNLIKFNETSEELEVLNSNYDIPYMSYNNRWTGIDNEKLVETIDDKLNFSYSNISTYYECPFKFYVKNVLKVYDFEETFEQFIGNLFHHVLEKCLSGNLDIDLVYDEYVSKATLPFSNANHFFIKLLKKEIHFVVTTIKDQYEHSSHLEEWKEKKIEVEKERKIRTRIKGFVDKLLVLNNKVIVIDYKTGNSDKVDPDLFKFGLNLQLPIYLYLLKLLDDNIEVAGLYLQHILNLDTKFNPKKDVLNEKKNNLKLDGITINDQELIANFDDTYEDSEVIKSLKVLKNGEFRSSKKVITKDERAELTDLIEQLINNCIDLVSEGSFEIKPIKIPNHADGCMYCEYKDICYREYKDFNICELTSEGDDEDE